MPYDIMTTEIFDDWFDSIRDDRAQTAIRRNIVKLSGGLFGNAKPIGDGLSEMKIDVGAGYRLYFVTRGQTIIVLLMGGIKSSQRRDVACAKSMAGDLE